MRYTATEPRTLAQNGRLHLLLGKLGIDTEQRHELVHQFTNGRTTSSKALTAVECNQLIHTLEKQVNDGEGEKLYRMRRKMFSLSHDLGWELPNGKVDRARLDGFLAKYGPGKKPLMHLSVAELVKAITQLERVNEKQATNG